jgi:hypothetical protein
VFDEGKAKDTRGTTSAAARTSTRIRHAEPTLKEASASDEPLATSSPRPPSCPGAGILENECAHVPEGEEKPARR